MSTPHDAAAGASADEERADDDLARHVRAVRLGDGANCSSVGSVVDTLFVSAAIGGAILAAVVAALRDEPVRVVGDEPTDTASGDASTDEEAP